MYSRILGGSNERRKLYLPWFSEMERQHQGRNESRSNFPRIPPREQLLSSKPSASRLDYGRTSPCVYRAIHAQYQDDDTQRTLPVYPLAH